MAVERIKKGTPCSFDMNPHSVQTHSKWLRNSLVGLSKPRVLDIGCGNGIYEQALSDNCEEMFGIDLDVKALRICREASVSADYIQANAEALPFADSKFDAVMIVEVIEHVEDPLGCLSEVCRVLRPNGVIMITAPNRGYPFMTHGITIGSRWYDTLLGMPFPLVTYLPKAILKRIWSARCYTISELVHALEASGFDPQEGVFFMPAFDGVLSGTSKIPASIRRMAQSISTRFNLRESSWFGSTIAVTAVRKADHRRTGQDSSSG
ncbi:MAG TPA: methyltransferase domain-containing protein [Thermoplasmata archaeon]